jgi:hypothetical protein|tara:strand:+ start:719 stop:1063 length:345 start_codon:yes stop_codon:yes gene_type:complete
MIDDWLNQNPDDGFNPNDHGIEMDEIAKLYAMADMKEDQEIWAREQANKFYNDFDSLNISDAILAVGSLIKNKALNLKQVNTMLANMIEVFKDDEEYEKCHVCNEIKKGINDKF